MTEWRNAAANAALDRMARAYRRRTGCHLTSEMVAALGLTFLAERWDEKLIVPNPDPIQYRGER